MMAHARILIRNDSDIVAARHKGRELMASLGFSGVEITLVTTAISELARNILEHGGTGEICLSRISQAARDGVEIIAEDGGPGIPDISLAMQDGYSTKRGLGLGLPGTRRLMDDFQIYSEVGKGTKVVAKKWKR